MIEYLCLPCHVMEINTMGAQGTMTRDPLLIQQVASLLKALDGFRETNARCSGNRDTLPVSWLRHNEEERQKHAVTIHQVIKELSAP